MCSADRSTDRRWRLGDVVLAKIIANSLWTQVSPVALRTCVALLSSHLGSIGMAA